MNDNQCQTINTLIEYVQITWERFRNDNFQSIQFDVNMRKENQNVLFSVLLFFDHEVFSLFSLFSQFPSFLAQHSVTQHIFLFSETSLSKKGQKYSFRKEKRRKNIVLFQLNPEMRKKKRRKRNIWNNVIYNTNAKLRCPYLLFHSPPSFPILYYVSNCYSNSFLWKEKLRHYYHHTDH